MTNTQRRKLRRLLADAVNHVPWYRETYGRLGLPEAEFAAPDILGKLPVLTKDVLLGIPLGERTNRRFRDHQLTEESTTGSTGQPFSLYIDPGYRRRRNARFLRGLLSVGYRPWHRLMLLTDRHTGTSARRGGRHYVSVEQPTAAIAEAYARIQPDVLYGFTTPLRLLADFLPDRKPGTRRPRLVVSTAEMLDAATRRTLESAFGCPVADFYGMTEMGLVAWQRPDTPGYIMSRDAVLTEFVPEESCSGRYRMLMTNLDLRASPIIRFDAGDLAVLEHKEGKPTVMAFEGRHIDSIVCRDGSELSPYRVTDALRDVNGLRRFRVTQRETTAFTLDIEADPADRGAVTSEVTTILTELLGAGLELEFVYSDKLIPEGARKFRPVSSEVPRS